MLNFFYENECMTFAGRSQWIFKLQSFCRKVTFRPCFILVQRLSKSVTVGLWILSKRFVTVLCTFLCYKSHRVELFREHFYNNKFHLWGTHCEFIRLKNVTTGSLFNFEHLFWLIFFFVHKSTNYESKPNVDMILMKPKYHIMIWYTANR